MDKTSKWLMPKDVALMANVKIETVWKWVREGKLKAYRPQGGRRILISENDLNEFIKPICE
ncbi:helix-turn-helix domain-containing protein [Duncaniella muris]|uniref:helix-turn-helix domain-containing protein n=2 Tax=Duncaniella muris TaxID=2094150 RepID=UPI0034E53A14